MFTWTSCRGSTEESLKGKIAFSFKMIYKTGTSKSVYSGSLLEATLTKTVIFLTLPPIGVVPGSHPRHLLSCALAFKYDHAVISGIECLVLGLGCIIQSTVTSPAPPVHLLSRWSGLGAHLWPWKKCVFSATPAGLNREWTGLCLVKPLL